jgi:hypothetical protein
LDQELTTAFKHYVFKDTDNAEKIYFRLIDPKSRARSEAGETSIIDQLYSRYGLVCAVADNAVRPGIEDCRHWLENGFKIFDSLVNFQEERRTYRVRPRHKKLNANDPIEEPIRTKNHLMDCWRYIARTKPNYQEAVRYDTDAIDKPYIPIHERISGRLQLVPAHDVLGSEC